MIIDRGEGEEGGLYKRLFVALYVVLSNLLRTTHGYPDQYQLKFMSPVIHRALLAAEVGHVLLCVLDETLCFYCAVVSRYTMYVAPVKRDQNIPES